MGEQLKNLKCIKNALSLSFSEQSILSFTDSGLIKIVYTGIFYTKNNYPARSLKLFLGVLK